LLTGVADANLDKAPLVAITGQGSLDRLHHESHQNINVVQMFQPVTKWSNSIKEPQVTAEVVHKAFKLDKMEKPGATHIELSEDVARMEVKDIKPLKGGLQRRPAPDKASIKTAAELLKKSKQPIILAGNGAIRNRSSKELQYLATKFNLPVVATFMGKGAISDKLPQSLMAIGLGFKDYVAAAMEQTDLVLCVGYDIAEYAPDAWNPDQKKQIIHIDFEPAEVYECYQPQIEIIADIAETLRELAAEMEDRPDYYQFSNWYLPVREKILADFNAYEISAEAPFSVPGVIKMVRQILSDDGLVISDVGAHKMWIARNLPVYCPNGCIISNGLASMGIALPGGIAASMINPDRQIVCMMGDGGFMMNVQELETAKRLGISATYIVFNDNDYGLISWKQEMSTGRSAYTTLSNPDFKALAESFGIKAYSPKTGAELEQVLKETIPSKELNLIEIAIDPAVNMQLRKKLEQALD
jgi:acetolactate synthase-1/2/3 large subunit